MRVWFAAIVPGLLRLVAVVAVIAPIAAPIAAVAQQPQQQQQASPPPPVPQAQPQPSNEWNKLPRMQLERQFAGPLQDTIIQRWRDPVDGVLCYIYLPITAAHTPPTPSGFVQYGANSIGTISCLPPEAGAAEKAAAKSAGRRAPPRPASAEH
jgi:hypothetical protein